MDRRRFLQMGVGGALAGLCGRAFASPNSAAPARACILIFLHGGPSQFETFDPKPGTATGGPTRALETSVSGLRIAEGLPELARRMNRFGLVRTLSAREGNHDRARYLMHTGFPRQGGVVHPGFGSVVANAAGPAALPGYVSVGAPGQSPGYLGASLAPFPVLDPRKRVRNLERAKGISEARAKRRASAWRVRHEAFLAEQPGAVVAGQGQLHERALAMMQGSSGDAFALSLIPEARRARYGEGKFGQGCLLAHLLVSAGVPFVEVALRGWDTHQDNFERTTQLCAELDRGVSALADDLEADGLWSQTLLVCVGDFGRTPRINDRGGRDHFPKISNALLGGAGIRGGTVVGTTDSTGEALVERPVGVPDLFATIADRVGVDAGRVEVSAGGRPVSVVDEAGAVLSELV